MSKTTFLYVLLIALLVVRTNKVCEGDLLLCQAVERGGQQEQSYMFGEQKLTEFKMRTTHMVRNRLPSPHSELLLGMTVGIDRLYEIPKFKIMLRDTGTIHVVVVSGYNVTLVYNAIIKILGSPYKTKNLALAIAGTFVFSVISGFEPPVVRAWFMGSVIAFGKFYGRRIKALNVLLFTGLVMAVINPVYIYDLSFQLSFLATLSLVMFEQNISTILHKFIKARGVLLEDLTATLSAQLLIWPYLSYKFGQISLISPVINAMILWTVPIATIIGSVYLILGYISTTIGKLLATFVYIPLDFFVYWVEYFSKFKKLVLEYQLPLPMLIAYYTGLLIVYSKRRKENNVK